MKTEPGYTYKARVDSVTDGDTLLVTIDLGFDFRMSKIKLRLKDINCHELRDPYPEKRELAQEAKQFVKDMLPEGTEIIIQTFKTTGGNYVKTFDRYVADVYFDDENGEQVHLNKLILDSGHTVLG